MEPALHPDAAPAPAAAGESKIVRLADLRALIAEKFPQAPVKAGARFPTGLPTLDEAHGGLRKGALTEFSGSGGSGALFIEAMLAAAERERCFVALIDAARSFDPCGANRRLLRRLLWVACDDAGTAMKAADLLLRDGNLPLLLLDLQITPIQQLQRIPASTWHRFHRIVEQTTIAFVALTPTPLVEGARCRIAAEGRWDLASLLRPRDELPLTLHLYERSDALIPLPESTRKTA